MESFHIKQLSIIQDIDENNFETKNACLEETAAAINRLNRKLFGLVLGTKFFLGQLFSFINILI